jgi:hypothetical protein
LGVPGNEIDQFVEEIEFRETRIYVKAVMRNYRMYYELWESFCHREDESVLPKKGN